MWITVYNCNSGAAILNASFTVGWYNEGTGWYYLYIGWGQNFCVNAPGYYTVCGNTDANYNGMWASLCPIPPPPPPPPSNCWSG